MMKFLRYSSGHRLYFSREWEWPQLDPLCSRSHSKSGKRTFSIDEPLWFYRLRKRFFAFSGRQRCGRRGENEMWSDRNGGRKALPDTWNVGPDGNRTCSYCGSIHPDDLMVICRKAMIDPAYGIDGTDKSYKVYVRQPGVRNAAEGAIEFYTPHAGAMSKGDFELVNQAARLSHDRFMALREKVQRPTVQ